MAPTSFEHLKSLTPAQRLQETLDEELVKREKRGKKNRDAPDAKDVKDAKGAKDAKKVKDAKNAKDGKHVKDGRDAKGGKGIANNQGKHAKTPASQTDQTDTKEDETERLGKWCITVSNAVSGITVGQYFMAPSDLVRDLKDTVQFQLRPDRPWAVNGRLLHQTEEVLETVVLKDVNLQEPYELQFLLQTSLEDEMNQMYPRSEVLVLPEVVQKVLDGCKLQAYCPEVQWVLDSVTPRQSQEEIEELWKEICEDERIGCEDLRQDERGVSQRSKPWLELREGHRGARRKGFYLMTSKFEDGTLKFTYNIFNNGSYEPVENPPCGWFARASPGDGDGKYSAPLLAPLRNIGRHQRVTCFQASEQHLALPCAILALKSENFQVMEVLAADRFHGFGLRVGFDLILAVKSLKTLKSFVIGVYFHPLMTSGAFNIADMDALSHRYFEGKLFDNLLDAAVCNNIPQVLVMWHIDLVETLRWTLTPIPCAFRTFRRELAKQWFPDSDLRIEEFNKLLQHQLLAQSPLEPLLLDLPKMVCANPSCPAGSDCSKHQHLFEIPVAPPCPGGERCPRTRRSRIPCRRHHCRGQQGQLAQGPVPCHCVQLWVPTAARDIPWSPAKPKAKDKKAVDYASDDPKGLAALGTFLSSIRTNPLPARG